MKQNTYQKMHEDIDSMLDVAKKRQHWSDADAGKMLGISDRCIRQKRNDGTFPDLSFKQIFIIAQAADYEMSVPRSKGGIYQ